EHIDIDHLETPSPLNPLGIKGAGEAGVIPAAAVFASAIEDAEGIPITAMPISPSELFALRQRHAVPEPAAKAAARPRRRTAKTAAAKTTAAKKQAPAKKTTRARKEPS